MIHYHGVPLSGDTVVQIRALKAKHAMVSYENSSPINVVAEICQSFCIDNGAFSAWKKGSVIDIDSYAEFIRAWSKHPAFDFYVIPDVIDGSLEDNRRMIASWSKQGIDMRTLGAVVWHLHEPLDVLHNYCQSYYRVCIGSSGEYAAIGTKKWWSRMADAMSAACDSDGMPIAKLHGLRMLDPDVFSRFPFSSADSTNVARNIGIDSAWTGTYQPASKESRALIMCERIENHTSASKWSGERVGAYSNMELF